MLAKLRRQPASVGASRLGSPAVVVLLVGVVTTLLVFFFARASARDSERSIVRERTGQTFGVVETVLQQVDAIVAAGAAAARYTGGDPRVFRQATASGVGTSLVSSLSLLRLRSGNVIVLATVGKRALLLPRLTAPQKLELREIARSGANIRYVSTKSTAAGYAVGFAMSPRAGSDLVVWGEIFADEALAQQGGVASSDLRVAIYLGTTPSPQRLLISSTDGVPRGANVATEKFPIGEEELLVTLGPRHRLVSDFTWALSWVVLAIGLFETMVIAVLVERGRRRRDEALQLVADLERRTGELDAALAEQRRAQEEARVAAERLRHAQRMEAIGRLAGGVAHDFNNLLTAIIGSTRMLLRGTSPGDPLRSGLEDIERAADRAASLTRQLLAFSRKQVLQPTVVDLNRIVRETETMLRHLIRADIRLLTSLDPYLAPVEADAGQLEQVIINLVANAADAMPEGGTVVIATANVGAGAERAQGGRVRGDHALLSVSDDGIGMDEETRQRVFEPFFTTKELGRGTGLGLATVYGIVEQSGGSIDVESEPGRGTVFRILLPAVDKEVDEPPPEQDVGDSTVGTETVVVAEDDDMVRALIQVTLESSGYRVLAAPGGEEALELAERHDGPIDVLVTDMVMPGIGGRELAERLQASRPRLLVLYVSGYSEAEVGATGPQGEASFMQKPFTPEELARTLRALIDRARPYTRPPAG